MIKTLLIIAYLLCDWKIVAERLVSIGPSPMLAGFAILYLVLAAALLMSAEIRNGWIRASLAVLFVASSILQQAFVHTTEGAFSYEAFVNLYNASGQTSEAFAQYGHVLLFVVPVALLLFFGIALPPRKPRIPSWLALTGPLVALGLLTALLYARGGEGSRALPAAFPPIAFAGIMTAEDLLVDRGPRKQVTLPRANSPVPRDIVLLVDESVSGNYLDTNNPKGVRTGLLNPPKAVRLANFGYAASVHNCSANTNVVLRFGGTRDTYEDAMAHYPSIWAYAHKSGLRTVYIDAQSTDGRLQNLMGKAERAEIDNFVQFDATPPLQRDMEIAHILAQHINNGRPEFIYVNKIGAHFPVQDKYPDEFMRYRPVMERGQNKLSAWSSDRTGFNGTAPEWVRYRNSYRNTLLWNVGEFFHRFLTAADLDKATVIYTSDHGQDLHERHNRGNNTHCGSDLGSQEQGLVPLMVFEGQHVRSLDWAAHLAQNHNGLSHFRIFPTLLALMGYDRNAVRSFYGPALDEGGSDDFSYNIVFSSYLGRKPEFRKIIQRTIIDPPMSDYQGTR